MRRHDYEGGRRGRTRRSALILAAAGLALALGVRSDDRNDRVRELCRAAPALRVDVARHAMLDGDAAFRAYCRDVGPVTLYVAAGHLHQALEQARRERFGRTSDLVLPCLERVTRGLATEYGDPGLNRDARFRMQLDRTRGYRLHRLLAELRSLQFESPGTTRERVRRLQQLWPMFAALGYERGVMLAQNSLSGELYGLGVADTARWFQRAAIGHARRLGDVMLMCQYTGELGYRHLESGFPDSTRQCYDEAYALAVRHRFPDQAGRFLEFASNRHAREGRLAMATELAIRAQRVCRELRGGWMELRFVLTATRRFADLGSWDAVEQQLVRYPALLRQIEDPPIRSMLRYRAEALRARALMARGRVDAAEAIYRRLEDERTDPARRVDHPETLAQWAEGLTESGAHAAALPIVERALRHCDSLRVLPVDVPVSYARAAALFHVGRHRDAARALDDHVVRAGRNKIRDHGRMSLAARTLRARLAAALGTRAEARAAFHRAWLDLRDYARRLDAGSQAYLALEERRDLRRGMHEILARTPEQGYRLELDWRALPSELGRSGLAPGSSVGDAASVPATPGGAGVHVVYLVLPESVVRWTASAGTVSRDTLAITREACVREVGRVVELLGVPRETRSKTDDAELGQRLRGLSDLLLPQAMRRGRGTPLFLSADGPLASLPFEALDVGPPGRYEPLGLGTDVAYLRPTRPPAGSRRGQGTVLVVDPDVPDELGRRYPGLRRRPDASDERNLVARHWPDVRVLSGPHAVKRDVQEALGQARRVFLAAHVARVPEVPFLTFVPLAARDGADDSDAALEIQDVRTLDLSGCELAVLSGCASGAPYVSGSRVAPSFGDAFLDAGARAVIQTFLEVGEREAVDFAGFVLAALDSSRSPVAALNRARRDHVARAGRAADPAAWATWSVAIRSPGAGASDAVPAVGPVARRSTSKNATPWAMRLGPAPGGSNLSPLGRVGVPARRGERRDHRPR